MSRLLQWRSSRFLTMFWSWRTCLKSSFSKCKCPGGYDGDPHVFTNVLVMKNMLEIHFSKCECPSGYNGDPHVFCQCSGHEEHVWNPFFRMWHQILLQNSWISREETPDMDTLKLQKYCRRSQKCPFLKIKCFLWITPPLRYGLA